MIESEGDDELLELKVHLTSPLNSSPWSNAGLHIRQPILWQQQLMLHSDPKTSGNLQKRLQMSQQEAQHTLRSLTSACPDSDLIAIFCIDSVGKGVWGW